MAVEVQEITGTARSVNQLLSNNRYGLDFYQREYSWKEAQVGELVDDLVERFLDEFDGSHDLEKVASYRPYCLGPIVTAKREGIRFLVDGQQRITTLTLLLIFLRRHLPDSHSDERGMLESLIFSVKFGRKSFNLDVEEREPCLSALLAGDDYDSGGASESVRNLWDQFNTIEDRFPLDSIDNDHLVYFVYWLLERAVLVDIGAPDQTMALEIFETMNDRGLRLSMTDMLKGFLLARVEDENAIRDLNDQWRRRITELTDEEKNADAEFIKAWLRGDYAETQRQRRAKAAPGDFDLIGTAFHKWVRDKKDTLGLAKPSDYRTFIEKEFLRLSRRYLQLLEACKRPQSGLDAVFYNARNGFTLQLPVILAAITSDDDDSTFQTKAALISGALDIYVARRMVNYRNFGYSTVVYTVFNLMKDLRNRPVDEVRQVLARWLDNESEQMEAIRDRDFGLSQRNRKHIHYLLARITAWMDGELGNDTTAFDYLARYRKDRYEVEHIWADHFDNHLQEFDNQYDFARSRNKIGGLVLLPKSFNASFGDMPYEKKVGHYFGQNSLVRSLHPLAYSNNPNFRYMCQRYQLPFKSYPESFSKSDLEERQDLYRKLAEVVWNPARIGLGVTS